MSIADIYSREAPPVSEPVTHPTWFGTIRYMFTDEDIAHMKAAMDLDLSSYDAVSNLAGDIYGQVAMKKMPPGRPWSDAWVKTFLNWMSDDYPKGVPPVRPMALMAVAEAAPTAGRVRKEISELSKAELKLVAKAFEGMKKADADDPNGYFVQAGYHWLPAPFFCQHHVPGYNPWHRAFLMSFENAMRAVPGCEKVTLPYWDITKPFPEALRKAPFDSYTLPRDIGGGYDAGYVTERFPYPDIEDSLRNTYEVDKLIANALSRNTWEGFHGLLGNAPHDAIIAAHDGGHNAIGRTMENPGIAAFDPVFWFFHCNWDRLFWKWQQQMDATTLPGLMSTITDELSRQYFTVPALQEMKPFTALLGLKTIDVVDSVKGLDVDYAHPADEPVFATLTERLSAVPMKRRFRADTSRVNVRVGNINRLNVPGSFDVQLLLGDKVLGTRGFFQPDEARSCATCSDNADVHFDFELAAEDIAGGDLSARVAPRDRSIVGDRFPTRLLGEPTIQVTLPLMPE